LATSVQAGAPVTAKQAERLLKVTRALAADAGAVHFEDESFEDVIDWMRGHGLPNIIVDWARIESAGGSRDAAVSLRLEGLSVGEVLDFVLETASEEAFVPTDRLTYEIDRGVVRITTMGRAAERYVVRVYDIEHLLHGKVVYGDAPEISVAGTGNQGGGGGGATGNSSGGEGSNIFNEGQGGAGGAGNPGIEFDARRAAKLQTLLGLLRRIRPETWMETPRGSGQGTVTAFGDKIVITQLPEVHEMIGGLR
jgi:hypothetical protein